MRCPAARAQTSVTQRFFGQVRVDRSTTPSPTFRLFSAERPADCMLAARCLDAVGEYVVCAHADQISLASPHYVGAVRYVTVAGWFPFGIREGMVEGRGGGGAAFRRYRVEWIG